MARYVVAVVVLLATLPANGKCLDGFYTVKGRVVDRQNLPVEGALVGASWSEAGLPAGPTMEFTNSRGEYTLYLRFHTWVGMSRRGDICTGKLQQISVSAAHGDKESIAFPVKVGHPDTQTIRPPLLMVHLPRSGR